MNAVGPDHKARSLAVQCNPLVTWNLANTYFFRTAEGDDNDGR